MTTEDSTTMISNANIFIKDRHRSQRRKASAFNLVKNSNLKANAPRSNCSNLGQPRIFSAAFRTNNFYPNCQIKIYLCSCLPPPGKSSGRRIIKDVTQLYNFLFSIIFYFNWLLSRVFIIIPCFCAVPNRKNYARNLWETI